MARFILPALAIVLILVSVNGTAQAQNAVQLSVFDPIQLVKNTDNVNGIRLNLIYTKNANVSGLDLGFIYNYTTGNEVGFQSALVSKVDGHLTGVQWSMVSLVGGKMTGWQSGAYNSA